MNNYTVLHLHDDRSLLDSCTKFVDYVKYAKELGQTSIALTNHGVIYNWVSNKETCEKYGLKYIHGVEVYLTASLEPKVHDNYHTILLAKNYEGVKEINKLVSLSNSEDHFYYKPRLSFEEFYGISDNVIKLSACLASPLNSPEVQKNVEEFVKLVKHYDYLEIQPHDCDEQRAFNKLLYKCSQKYHKPLVATTDTHSLNKYKAECRRMLLRSKDMTFQNEDRFDLTYYTYDELVAAFAKQNALPEDVYLSAIANTNVIADSVEDFSLDKKAKYPILYDDDESVIKQRIYARFQDKVKSGVIRPDEVEAFKQNIKEEFEVFKATNMLGFMLSMSELVEWCHNNDIPTGFGRGSVCGSSIAYILNIIDVNPVRFKTIFSRFCNKNRVELGDIDIDFPPSMREMVYNHIFNQFGTEHCAYVLALGTISTRGCIDDIARGLKDEGGKRKYSLEETEDIKNMYEQSPSEAKKQYADLFYYFDGMLDTYISQSMHPAGIIISPIILDEEYGVFYNDGLRILQLDMEDSHDVNLVKYDILGLKSIAVINDTCKLAGIPYPLSHEIDWEDQNVYDEIKLSPVGIFQYESAFAWDSVKKYDCHSIFDLSLVNACIRPSGESYRDEVLNHVVHKNPTQELDDLLAGSAGLIVYQEDTIKFLQEICGFSGSDADSIRRAIGKKDVDFINKMLPKIVDGYCAHSDKPRKEAEQEARDFVQVIQDSSSYSFGYNHSIAYSMIGYLCGWLRRYYPYEFIVSYLNNAQNQDDLNTGAELIKTKGMTLRPIEFRHSRDGYYFDKDSKSIYKGLDSIKTLNQKCAAELEAIGENFKGSFCDLLDQITQSNAKQIKVLILLDYFKEFGKSQKLLKYYYYYSELKGRKEIAKTMAENGLSIDETFRSGVRSDTSSVALHFDLPLTDIKDFCHKETQKKFAEFDFDSYLRYIWSTIEDEGLPLDSRLKGELYFAGKLSYVNPQLQNVYIITEAKTYGGGTAYLTMYDLSTGEQIKTKTTNQATPLSLYSVIRVSRWKEAYKKTRVVKNGKIRWEDTDEKYNVLEDWILIK